MTGARTGFRSETNPCPNTDGNRTHTGLEIVTNGGGQCGRSLTQLLLKEEAKENTETFLQSNEPCPTSQSKFPVRRHFSLIKRAFPLLPAEKNANTQ